MNKKQAELQLNMLLNKVKDCNIYVHHIWELNDSAELIKKYVLQEGLNVKYNKSMFSTVFPIENATAENIFEYFFSQRFPIRTNIVFAIPKEFNFNGAELPFSNNVIKYGESRFLNDAYLSPFDLVRGKLLYDKIPKEYILCLAEVNEKAEEYGVVENKEFNPYTKTKEIEPKIVSYFDLDNNDDSKSTLEKLTTTINKANENVGNREIIGYESDFDFD